MKGEDSGLIYLKKKDKRERKRIYIKYVNILKDYMLKDIDTRHIKRYILKERESFWKPFCLRFKFNQDLRVCKS